MVGCISGDQEYCSDDAPKLSGFGVDLGVGGAAGGGKSVDGGGSTSLATMAPLSVVVDDETRCRRLRYIVDEMVGGALNDDALNAAPPQTLSRGLHTTHGVIAHDDAPCVWSLCSSHLHCDVSLAKSSLGGGRKHTPGTLWKSAALGLQLSCECPSVNQTHSSRLRAATCVPLVHIMRRHRRSAWLQLTLRWAFIAQWGYRGQRG